jgi:hypothetical protein
MQNHKIELGTLKFLRIDEVKQDRNPSICATPLPIIIVRGAIRVKEVMNL